MSESYILCEGYHDRAFWKGFLIRMRCIDPGADDSGKRKTVRDPFGDPVRGGQYAYRSPSGKFIRVVPANGKENLLPLARNRLSQRDVKPVSYLILNVDSDEHADGSPAPRQTMPDSAVLQLAREFDAAAALAPGGEIQIDRGATTIALTRWQAADPPARGLPNQHTLERVISAAVVAAYPERGPAVQDWLDARPSPPPAHPKEHAISYFAGWHASLGSYEEFCTQLWSDPRVVGQLETRLRDSGVWQLAERITA